MARRKILPLLRTGGSLWGPERVAAGLSLRDLESATRISRGFLSRMENGRMIPTSAEYQRIMAALETLKGTSQTEGVVEG